MDIQDIRILRNRAESQINAILAELERETTLEILYITVNRHSRPVSEDQHDVQYGVNLGFDR